MGSEFIITEKNKEKILILLIVLFGFVLRLYKLHSNDFWLDEVHTIIVSNLDFPHMLENLIKSCQPPSYYFFMHFWIKYFNFNDYFLEIPSAIFGSLTVLVAYIFAKEMFNKKVAFSTAIFVALSPVAIFFSKETRPYSLLILLTTLSMYYFYKLVEDKDNKKNTILFVVYSALAFYTQYVFIYFLMAQNVYVIIIKRKLFLKFILLQFFIFLLFLPWLPIFIKQLKITSVMNLASQNINFFTILGLLNIIHHMKVEIDIVAILFVRILIPLMVFASIILLIKKRDEKYTFLLFYLILPIAIAISLSILGKPIFIDRQISPALVPYFIFLSAGIHNFLKYDLDQKIVVTFVSSMLFIALILTVYKWNDKSHSRAINYIKKHYKANEYIITLEEADTAPIIYYNKYNITHFILPKYSSKHIDTIAFKFPCTSCRYFDNIQELLQVMTSKMKIYLISSKEGLNREKVKKFVRLIKLKGFQVKYIKHIQHLLLIYYTYN